MESNRLLRQMLEVIDTLLEVIEEQLKENKKLEQQLQIQEMNEKEED